MTIPLDVTIPSSCDIVVIGGGINGAAVARDAAMRGLKVVLFEKDDFGSGASTKTSKLAHGGLRYLEHSEFGLVRESLQERKLLLQNAPHLVRPLFFVLPVYKNDPHPLWKLNLGLYLYDYLGGQGALPKHRKLDNKKILNYFPGLKQQDLQGACLYCDAQMADNRLVIENIIAAEQAGARVFNHTTVIDLYHLKGRIKGVFLKCSQTQTKYKIDCKVVVNATGAWSNQIDAMESGELLLHVKPSKGVHVVIPKIENCDAALFLRTPQDGRVFFVIPWFGLSLIGTTDTFFDENPDDLIVTQQDRTYLLEAVNAYFPDQKLSESSIISSFVGLRPLVSSERGKAPSEIARSHVIRIASSGLITVLGGKYTTHRKIAEDVVDTVLKQLNLNPHTYGCLTSKIKLPGALSSDSIEEIKQKLKILGVTEKQASHLLSTYGLMSLQILEIIRENKSELIPISKNCPHITAEITYGVKFEHVKTLNDWFFRRTYIGYMPGNGMDCYNLVAEKLKLLLDWSKEQFEWEVNSYSKKPFI